MDSLAAVFRAPPGRRSCDIGDRATVSMLRPEVVLDIAQNFTTFAADRQRRKIK